MVLWERPNISSRSARPVCPWRVTLSPACVSSAWSAHTQAEGMVSVCTFVAHSVTIETWLGPPDKDKFWRHCVGIGWGFPVQLELDRPLGNRELVDPACALDRYTHLIACEESKLARTGQHLQHAQQSGSTLRKRGKWRTGS